MDRYTGFVTKHRKSIVVFFLVVSVVCVILQAGVKVNYNMADYLPESAPSTTAVAIMEEAFTQAVPNANVMIHDVGIPQALEYKAALAEVPGVAEVLWLDDMVDVLQPLETQDAATVEQFYKDGTALYQVSIADGRETEATAAIRALIGEENAVAGEAPDLDSMRQATSGEVLNALVILLPAIIALLVLTTTSWVEGIFFLLAIGVSILMNMGTNIFFGEVSFVTFSVSPILQLAVSLDYAIFLLHRFADFRQKYADPERAMQEAMKVSMKTVAASAATTLFGFLALAFMGFQIGADLGINLAKGIILSFISCMVFLPALTLCSYKIIDKTRHRPFFPSFKGIYKGTSKVQFPIMVVVALIAVPCFLGQSHTDFIYASVDKNPEIRNSRERMAIEDTFGQNTIMALLVPKGDVVKEYDMGQEIEALDHVAGVMSYASSVGTGIPAEFLSDDVTSQFYSDGYARIIVYTDTPSEGDVAFATVEAINGVAAKYYDTYYAAGQSANLYDMRDVVAVDNTRVNLIAILAILAVLVITFRGALLPLVLLLTIEVGIWINLAIPYFTGTPINFIGYLVLSTVQLGATVDYAILLTSNYLHHRQKLRQKDAMARAMGDSFKSILVSGATLALAGFTLYATSSNPAICDIGLLLGRGTLLSMAMVVFFLPALLRLLDKPIAATTWKANFFRPGKRGKKEPPPPPNTEEINTH
ncbi:MAG: MMPL family transporter [Ruminococcaceae bacterium]|nr:MMPL family transporter [Oscillospiraceae bacterium]